MYNKICISLFAWMALTMQVKAGTDGKAGFVCPTFKIETEHLPDLNVARSGHSVLNLNGEITVIGGHTSGFLPTPTAEFLNGDKWQVLDMTYTHDMGIALPLKSGKVLLAGGCEQYLGIGQSFVVEQYDPQTHTFHGFGCLDRKRALFHGLELDSGRVVITGNWYHEDAVELFDGKDRFSFVKDVTQQRSYPQIFRIAPDDAIIFGSYDPWGARLDSTVIDRVKGESYTSPFFHEWRPLSAYMSNNCDDSFIGDEAKGLYAYLFPVENASGQIAIARVDGMDFSLLPTACPVPTVCNQKPISYYSSVLVDRQSKRAYLVGTDNTDNKDEGRHYILCIEYGKAETEGAAPLTLYYTDPMPESATAVPVLTDEGNMLLVGGTPIGNLSDNFHPSPSVILLRFGSTPAFAEEEGSSWLWVLLLSLVIVAAGTYAFHRWHRRTPEDEAGPVAGNVVKKDEELMLRIERLMDEQQLFLRPGLKVSDVATALDTNSRYVSNCIKAAKGCAFLKFVNGYRIRYAQHILSQQPGKKISNIAMESGFSNDKSFLRTFKEFTGTTPAEWRNSRQK